MATDLSSLFQLQNGQALRVDCLGAGLFRVRAGPGDCLHESGLNRYGIIRPEPDLTAGAVARSRMPAAGR